MSERAVTGSGLTPEREADIRRLLSAAEERLSNARYNGQHIFVGLCDAVRDLLTARSASRVARDIEVCDLEAELDRLRADQERLVSTLRWIEEAGIGHGDDPFRNDVIRACRDALEEQ